jgi:hypothetical protein
MAESPLGQDLSHLDRKYFLDANRYNCPFCNRGSVSYTVLWSQQFNWSAERQAFVYVVQCGENDCRGRSLHLSNFHFPDPAQRYVARFSKAPDNLAENAEFDPTQLDSYFFFHQPTSFFTIDDRIHSELRELISEAENCLKGT